MRSCTKAQFWTQISVIDVRVIIIHLTPIPAIAPQKNPSHSHMQCHLSMTRYNIACIFI